MAKFWWGLRLSASPPCSTAGSSEAKCGWLTWLLCTRVAGFRVAITWSLLFHGFLAQGAQRACTLGYFLPLTLKVLNYLNLKRASFFTGWMCLSSSGLMFDTNMYFLPNLFVNFTDTIYWIVHSFFIDFFFWSIVDLQCCVGFGYIAKWFSYINTCICIYSFSNSYLLQDIEYGSLCYTGGLCWLSILYIVVYIC